MKQTGRKWTSWLLTLALLLGMLPALGGTAKALPALDPVSYIDHNATTGAAETKSCTSYTAFEEGVDSELTTIVSGWYVIKSGNAVATKRLVVSGRVDLILCDGAALIARKGITVGNGNTLNIYTGSTGETILGTGKLYAGTIDGTITTCEPEYAGIGGSNSAGGGTVTIHGGEVTAQGNTKSAGIGGGNGGAGGAVTIYGGSVSATGDSKAAGIGGGNGGDGGMVTIYGGTVTANGGEYAAGIGGGEGGAGGTVTIYGGTVTANGGEYVAGIGKGAGSSDNGTLDLRTGVKLQTSDNGTDWSEPTTETPNPRPQYMKTTYTPPPVTPPTTPDPTPTPTTTQEPREPREPFSESFATEGYLPDSFDGGAVTVSPANAGVRDTVTLTVKPDAGMQLKDLTVTFVGVGEIKTTDKGGGVFAFTMPGGHVSIDAVFEPEGTQPAPTVTPTPTPTPAPAPAQPKVVASPQKLTVNGAERDVEAYNVDGTNFFKLRDLAALLSGTAAQFNVEYNAESNAIIITTGAAYDGEAGAAFTDKSATAVKSPQTVYIDGAAVSLDAYNIGGYNFFGLRELSSLLGYAVDYDEATNTAQITAP